MIATAFFFLSFLVHCTSVAPLVNFLPSKGGYGRENFYLIEEGKGEEERQGRPNEGKCTASAPAASLLGQFGFEFGNTPLESDVLLCEAADLLLKVA